MKPELKIIGKYLTYFAIASLVVYAIAAFGAWELNPGRWHEGLRAGIAGVAGIGLYMTIACASFEISNIKTNRP